jgi:ABC-2 type transport system permease protein
MTIWTKLENRQFDLFKELVKTRFKLRYNNSVLGFVWVLMKPLLNFLILYFIFTAFRSGSHDPSFAANLFIGLILYYFFNESIIFGMNSLMDMANIILKVNFPRNIAVMSGLMMAVINFFINFLVIIVFTLLLGFRPNLGGVIYFGFIVGLIFFLAYSITQFLSILFVKVRDLTNIVELGFNLLFWASAIFYNLEDMEGVTGQIIRLNPLALLIDSARKAFVLGEIAHVKAVLIIVAGTLVLFFMGKWFFNKNIRKIAEYF